MNRQSSKTSSGFTIVEVMIVLAVTALMFVSVALVINGKQQSAEFESSIRDTKSQIQQVINEAASGYPNYTGNCMFSSNSIVTNGTGTTYCTFLGKLLHFSNDNSGMYSVYPIVADKSQLDSATSTSTLANVKPQLLVAGLGTNKIQYGLNVVSMTDLSNAPVGSVGFIQSFAPGTATGTELSGAQTMQVIVPKNGSSIMKGNKDEETAVKGALSRVGQYEDSAETTTGGSVGVKICFQSGSTSQSGQITIGNQGNGLSVDLKIFQDKHCGTTS